MPRRIPGRRLSRDPVPSLNSAFKEAQEVISKAGINPNLAERARKEAENVLTTFFTAMGWQIEVRWK